MSWKDPFDWDWAATVANWASFVALGIIMSSLISGGVWIVISIIKSIF